MEARYCQIRSHLCRCANGGRVLACKADCDNLLKNTKIIIIVLAISFIVIVVSEVVYH